MKLNHIGAFFKKMNNTKQFRILIFITIGMIIFSCSSFLNLKNKNEFSLQFLSPFPDEFRIGSYYYQKTDTTPTLIIDDSIAFLDFNTKPINPEKSSIIKDTLFPFLSYYCIKLGESYRCESCPGTADCDCWKCADSSKKVSIFKGAMSQVFMDKSNQLRCTFIDTTNGYIVSIGLVKRNISDK